MPDMVGLDQHEPTSLRGIANRWRTGDGSACAEASATKEPDAGILHLRVCAGGAPGNRRPYRRGSAIRRDSMGGIAEAIAAYAQPLLDQTDGSTQQMNSAFALGQLCWNLALLPEQGRDEALAKMRPTLKMDDDQFETFRRSVVVPMIQRHQEMFRACTGWVRWNLPEGLPRPKRAGQRGRVLKSSRGTGRNAPCPSNSGRKYKLCCGR